MRNWISRAVLVYLALAGFAVAVHAGTPQEYQEMEYWCIARNKWEDAQRTGPFPPQPERSFHYHHYCDAVRGLGKMYAPRDKQDFGFQYNYVIDNTGYVIRNVPKDHHLLPLVYLLAGKAHYLAKQYALAEASYIKATQLDPHYAPVQSALGYLYIDTNRKEQAVKAVKAGLEADPNSKSLRRMAADLGMKVEPPPAKVEPPATPASPPAESNPVAAATPAAAKQAPAAAPAAPTTKQEIAPSDKDAPIGMPTNPWCRFCTDTPPASMGATPSTPGVISAPLH